MLHKKRTSLFAALLLLAMLCLAGCGSTDNQAYVEHDGREGQRRYSHPGGDSADDAIDEPFRCV